MRELAVTFDGTRVGETPDTPAQVRLRFATASAAQVPGGGRSRLGVGRVPSDIGGYDPAPNGPCIQETRTYNNHLRTQTWIASAPVADSDLYRVAVAAGCRAT